VFCEWEIGSNGWLTDVQQLSGARRADESLCLMTFNLPPNVGPLIEGGFHQWRQFRDRPLIVRDVSNLEPAFQLQIVPCSQGIFAPQSGTFLAVLMHSGDFLRTRVTSSL
jgi:hypothetical protein